MSGETDDSHQTEQHTCRICQGEGTPEDPLFYPCKCRGSIKYIHQICLEEWLKHSGRNKKPACDICKTTYNFTTVYDENTPDKVPFRLLLSRLKDSTTYFIRYATQVSALFFGCVIQIPFFWSFCTRLFNWILDRKSVHSNLILSIIYGDSPVTDNPYSFQNLSENLAKTYVSALTGILAIISVCLFLFIEHEWVSKDSGFTKLVWKRIGQEHRSTNEWIQRAANRIGERQRNLGGDARQVELDRRLDENLRNLANLNRIIQMDDQAVNREQLIGDAVRLLAERREEFQERAQRQQVVNERERAQRVQRAHRHNRERMDHADRHFVNEVMQEQLREAMAAQGEDDGYESEEDPEFVPFSDSDTDFEDELEFVDDALVHGANVQGEGEMEEVENEESDVDGEAFDNLIDNIGRDNPLQIDLDNGNIQIPNPNPNPNPVPNIVPAMVDDAGFVEDEFLHEDFIMSLPVYLIIFAADVIIVTFLSLFYFFPSIIGNYVIIGFYIIISLSVQTISNILTIFKISPFLFTVLNFFSDFHPQLTSLVGEKMAKPLLATFSNYIQGTLPLSNFERLVPVVLNFVLLYSFILLFIKLKTEKYSPRNPLMGTQRKIFIALFDLVCTLKVFLIFGIELLVFPSFCGLILEFVLTPVFTYEVKFLSSKLDLLSQFIILRIGFNWGIGTGYMCLFALFVGMIRKYILRPGVLFFIRSPEDPNARLVHDALVRPLGLQLSRIALSGLVYTLFILIGFGVITHTMKGIESEIIPVDIFTVGSVFNAISFGTSIYTDKALITKYVRQYWARAFKIASAKARLSSFILGGSNPKERGHIVYRNFIAWLRDAKPDYTLPKSKLETKTLFATTEIQSCFVPDGNLVRAPKTDTISRKFVRKLFIPVTKDDIPLKTADEIYKYENSKYPLDEFDDSEDELTTTNQYEIVYRPPMFGMRMIFFFFLLWIFASILIVGGILLSNFIGKPIVAVCAYIISKAIAWAGDMKYSGDIVFVSAKLECSSLILGAFILSKALKKYDIFIINRHLTQNGRESVAKTSLFDDGASFLIEKLTRAAGLLILLLSISIHLTLILMMHKLCIERPLLVILKNRLSEHSLGYLIPVFHGLAVKFTIYPFLKLLKREFLSILSEESVEFKSIFRNLILPDLKRAIIYPGFVVLFQLWISYNLSFVSSSSKFFEILKALVLERSPVPDSIILAHPLVLLLALTYKAGTVISQYLNEIQKDLKKKHYSKGKTLQNSTEEEEISPQIK